MKLCSMACGSYCNRSGQCRADLFQGRSPEGYLVTVASDQSRLTPEIIKRMQREYQYNPQTKKLTGYKSKKRRAR
jgi:hypothetical protein